jgi:hypothetical protein
MTPTHRVGRRTAVLVRKLSRRALSGEPEQRSTLAGDDGSGEVGSLRQ